MPSEGADAETVLDVVKAEIDAALRSGGRPDPEAWIARHPSLAAEIRALADLRAALHAEGLLGSDDVDRREDALAGFEAAVQDAVIRGDRVDLVGWQARHPDLAPELERMAERAEFLRDALTGEAPPPAVRPTVDERETGLGRYRLIRRIANHAIGPVFLGEAGEPPARVELMILRPAIGKEDGWAILREADGSRGLAGPGFVRVVDVGEVRGVRYIAWEHVRGTSLEQAIVELGFHGGARSLAQVLPPRAAPVSEPNLRGDRLESQLHAPAAAAALLRRPEHVQAALGLVAAVAETLARAHLLGRPHLDLCPGAVVVTADGAPQIRWFGLARRFRGYRSDEPNIPVYRAPEVVLGTEGRLGWRADIYGAGALLHGLLLLEPPVWIPAGERNARESLARARAKLPASLALLPAPVAGLLARALAEDPADRPSDGAAFAAELRSVAAAPGGDRKAGAEPSGARPPASGVRNWLRRWIRPGGPDQRP